MAKDAEAHSSEDKEKREEIEARNALDGLVYNIEKMLKESGDKMQGRCGQDRGGRRCWPRAKKVLEGTPTSAELKAAHEKLTHASHKLAEVLYKANAARLPHRADRAAARPGAHSRAEEGRRRDRRRVRRRGRKEVGLAAPAYPPDGGHMRRGWPRSSGGEASGWATDCRPPLRF